MKSSIPIPFEYWTLQECWSACCIAVAGSHNSAAPAGRGVGSGWAEVSSDVILPFVLVCSLFSVDTHAAADKVVCCYASKAGTAQ